MKRLFALVTGLALFFAAGSCSDDGGGSTAPDTIAPLIGIYTPVAGSTVAASTLMVGGVAIDNGTSASGIKEVWVKLDTSSWTKATGTGSWSNSFSGVATGTRTAFAYAVDNQNNCSTTNQISFSYSNTTPAGSYPYIVGGVFQPQAGDPQYSYYSSAAGLSGSALRAALKTIISTGHTANTYASLWTSYQTTDSIPSGVNAGKVWDIYSDTGTGEDGPYYFTFVTDQDPGSGGGSEGEYYNREHSWPNSWFGGSSVYPQYADLMHLYPTDKYVNNQRGNNAYGNVSTGSTFQNGSKLGSPSSQLTGWGCTESTVFEPINAFKGDLARTYFYMCTRYFEVGTDTSPMTTGSYKLRIWAQNTLKAWHELDPVSSKETARNTAVQGIQHNRNPYIDYPGLVTIIDFTQ